MEKKGLCSGIIRQRRDTDTKKPRTSRRVLYRVKLVLIIVCPLNFIRSRSLDFDFHDTAPSRRLEPILASRLTSIGFPTVSRRLGPTPGCRLRLLLISPASRPPTADASGLCHACFALTNPGKLTSRKRDSREPHLWQSFFISFPLSRCPDGHRRRRRDCASDSGFPFRLSPFPISQLPSPITCRLHTPWGPHVRCLCFLRPTASL